MAMIETVRPAPIGDMNIKRAFVESASRFLAGIRARLQAARTAEQLSRLSPQLLQDVGLTESDVMAYRQKSLFF
jgi:uncharacterized protein YjiS (DUF1127 family)